jgi:hypothetical protein
MEPTAHATRSDFGPFFSFQVVEADTLRNIQNVTGSTRSEAINGNELGNVLEGSAVDLGGLRAEEHRTKEGEV